MKLFDKQILENYSYSYILSYYYINSNNDSTYKVITKDITFND